MDAPVLDRPEPLDLPAESHVRLWWDSSYQTHVTASLRGYGERSWPVPESYRLYASDARVLEVVARAQRWIRETPADYRAGWERGRAHAARPAIIVATMTDDAIARLTGGRAARIHGFRDGADGYRDVLDALPTVTMGARIGAARTRKSLSQGALAELAGVTQSEVSLWETGKREPGVSSLVRLADALEVTVDELLRDSIAR